MKYTTYELIAATNDWIEQTDEQREQATEQFWRAVDDYHLELEELKPRTSKSAWNFFRHGYAETGLHDARLLSFTVGDGLSYVPDGTAPFRINRQRTLARIEFLNFTQEFRHVFEMRGIKRVGMNLLVEEDSFIKSIGDLYTYELIAVDEEYLRLGFLFATGAEIEIDFKKLLYKRHRIRRQYDSGERHSGGDTP